MANAAILDRFDLTIELLTGRPAQARPVADAPQGLLRDIESDVAVRPDQLADIAEEIETESRGRNIWETGTALPESERDRTEVGVRAQRDRLLFADRLRQLRDGFLAQQADWDVLVRAADVQARLVRLNEADLPEARRAEMDAFLTTHGLAVPSGGSGIRALTDGDVTVAGLERLEGETAELEEAARAEGIDLEGPSEPFRREDLEAGEVNVLEMGRRGGPPRLPAMPRNLASLRAGAGIVLGSDQGQYGVRIVTIRRYNQPIVLPIDMMHLRENSHIGATIEELWHRAVIRRKSNYRDIGGSSAFVDVGTALASIEQVISDLEIRDYVLAWHLREVTSKESDTEMVRSRQDRMMIDFDVNAVEPIGYGFANSSQQELSRWLGPLHPEWSFFTLRRVRVILKRNPQSGAIIVETAFPIPSS